VGSEEIALIEDTTRRAVESVVPDSSSISISRDDASTSCVARHRA